MRLIIFFAVAAVVILAMSFAEPSPAHAQGPNPVAAPQKGAAGDLVYADFETTKYDRPASSRGGFIQIFSFQENEKAAAKVKGLAGSEPAAPELVKPSKDEANMAATFEYELFAPNQYGGVGMIILGLPDQDGKPVAEDVTGFSYLTVQASATGISSLTVEFISQGQGINISVGSPQAIVQVTPSLSVYKIPLADLAQPAWATVKVDTKDVLRKLTAINFIVGCSPCSPTKGKVVLDNIVLHR